MCIDSLTLLRLMQLADSALPIGAAAHSFGLETLVVEGWLSVERLEAFLRDYLEEAGALEGVFCLRGYQLGRQAISNNTAENSAQVVGESLAGSSDEATK